MSPLVQGCILNLKFIFLHPPPFLIHIFPPYIVLKISSLFSSILHWGELYISPPFFIPFFISFFKQKNIHPCSGMEDKLEFVYP